MRRVLVGTIGYHNLRDYSIGPKLFPQLQAEAWPVGVEVDEMNWGPIAIVQRFETLAEPFERLVILAAIAHGLTPGTITLRRWRGGLPDTEEIQDRVSEAVTGVISLDNLLIVGEYFGIWPEETIIVDVEPGPQEAGDTFSPSVAAVIPDVLQTVRAAALEDIDALGPMEDFYGDRLGDQWGLWARVEK